MTSPTVQGQKSAAWFPTEQEMQSQVGGRRRRGSVVKWIFLMALMLAVMALVTLLITIINSAFGYVALENTIEPDEIVSAAGFPEGTELTDLPKDDLVTVLGANISTNLGRRFEREQRFYDDRLVFESQELWDEVCASGEPPAGCTLPARDQGNVYALVLERVVEQQIVATYSHIQSVFDRNGIEAELAETNPEAVLEFRSWISMDFLTSPQSPVAATAGIRTAILGSLWIILITIVFSLPVGVGAALYLEEYAPRNRLTSIIQTNINNLAGVPSIIYGMLGLAIFVRAMEAFTSGGFLDDATETTANGRTILSAGLTLGLLILPLIIINAQEALKAVPNSLRAAGLGLGATKWQTIRAHVLPNAIPGILTGAILAIARAIGETAPLVVIGASTFITTDPTGPFSKFTAMPIQIFQWTSRPQDEFRNLAAAAIIVLLVMLLALNATAVLLRNRYARRL